MPPLHRDHFVHGPYTLKGGKLTFRTGSALLAQETRLAMTAGREFTVCLTPPEGIQEVKGEVLSVELVESAKPAQWEIVMRVSA